MRRKVPILLYHRVGERDGSFMDRYTLSASAFVRQMEWLYRNDWRPTALTNVLAPTIDNLPERSVIITFDDGFLSNRIHAWPVLRKYGFPSATFVVTQRLGSRNLWDGHGRDCYDLLSVEDIASADSELMTFHSHTMTHADLPKVGETLARAELQGSRQALSKVRGGGSFSAYPLGSWDWQVVNYTREAGYSGACSCLEGLNSARTNPFLLRRVEIKEEDSERLFNIKLRTGRDWSSWRPSRPELLSHVRSRFRRRYSDSSGNMS